jgi:hypothetical protein
MDSPLRTISAAIKLAPLYAAVAFTTLFVYFGFTGLDLKVGITTTVSWVVPAILGVLMLLAIITFFEEED